MTERPDQFDCDYFVIGAGSGGVRSARIAAGHGARVLVAEDGRLGGTCVNVGCVPKKLMVFAAEFSRHLADAAGFGWTFQPGTHDWGHLIRAKDVEITRLNGIYRSLLEQAGAEILPHRAVLRSPWHVEAGGRTYAAKHILIATGGRPVRLPCPGGKGGIVSDDVFYLEERPRRIAVIGAGYIAAEFATIFHNLGAEVTLLHRGPELLKAFDQDLRRQLMQELQRQGLRLRQVGGIAAIEPRRLGGVVHLPDGSSLEADLIFQAIGRRPNTDGLGLEAAGVETNPDSGAICVDERYATSQPHIFAVGDVTDRVNLTPVAIAEGHAVADNLFSGRPERLLDYRNVPTAIFTIPPIGTVGLTEEMAREECGKDLKIFRTLFHPLRNKLSGRPEQTLMKLLVRESSDKVIGVHMIGPDAGEIIQGFAVAMTAGATKAHFDQTFGVHPTAAEEFVTLRTPVKSP